MATSILRLFLEQLNHVTDILNSVSPFARERRGFKTASVVGSGAVGALMACSSMTLIYALPRQMTSGYIIRMVTQYRNEYNVLRVRVAIVLRAAVTARLACAPRAQGRRHLSARWRQLGISPIRGELHLATWGPGKKIRRRNVRRGLTYGGDVFVGKGNLGGMVVHRKDGEGSMLLCKASGLTIFAVVCLLGSPLVAEVAVFGASSEVGTAGRAKQVTEPSLPERS